MNSNEFRLYAINAFRDLSLKYDLQPLDTPSGPEDFTARFRNDTTNVAVLGTHYGFGVNVRLSSARRRHMEFATYDLDDLLAIRAIGHEVIRPRVNANEIQKRQLDAYAALLDEYASDVLAGDFVVFPLLAQAIETRIKHQNAKGSLGTQSHGTTGKAKPWWKWW